MKRSARAPALDILLAHQHADGGFRTFADAEAWSPHLDRDARSTPSTAQRRGTGRCDAESRGSSNTNAVTEAGRRSR